MTRSPNLTVAISTLGSRLFQLEDRKLPRHENVVYDIFIQAGTAELRTYTALAFSRPDIRLFWLETTGVAHSRNAALINATTPFLVFADDDMDLEPDGHQAAISRLLSRPEIDFFCCRLRDAKGLDFKHYPPDGRRAHKTNCARVGTPEIVLRVERFRKMQLTFDTGYGAGMPCNLGDEYIFLCDALNARLKGEHAAIYHGTHALPSTGHIFDAQTFRMRRRVLDRALGVSAPIYRLPFACKHFRRFASWGDFLTFIF